MEVAMSFIILRQNFSMRRELYSAVEVHIEGLERAMLIKTRNRLSFLSLSSNPACSPVALMQQVGRMYRQPPAQQC